MTDFVGAPDLPDGCPPPSAVPANGTYYRLVRNNPPTDDDFRRPRDLPRSTPLKEDELCVDSALSLFEDPKDVHLARQYVPGFKKKKVAQGTLVPTAGVTLHSPTLLSGDPVVELASHTEWWESAASRPRPVFVVVEL